VAGVGVSRIRRSCRGVRGRCVAGWRRRGKERGAWAGEGEGEGAEEQGGARLACAEGEAAR